MAKSLLEIYNLVKEADDDPKQMDQFFNELNQLIKQIDDKFDEVSEKLPALEKNKNYENLYKTWRSFTKSTISLWKELKKPNTNIATKPSGSGTVSELTEFAKTVMGVLPNVRAGGGNDDFYGRYLISDVYDALNDKSLSLDDFKNKLLQAHTKGLIVLERIDLTRDIPDQEALAKSETKYLTARYHWIIDSKVAHQPLSTRK